MTTPHTMPSYHHPVDNQTRTTTKWGSLSDPQ